LLVDNATFFLSSVYLTLPLRVLPVGWARKKLVLALLDGEKVCNRFDTISAFYRQMDGHIGYQYHASC